jgi:hypothetical protein
MALKVVIVPVVSSAIYSFMSKIITSITVITLNYTIHAYLASGQLISLHCQSHAEQTLEKPLKSSNPCPNPLLGALERWQALYCTCWNAGWPTTARVYLTKQKIRKVADGTKRFGSVNWNSQPCMAESSSKTLAPSSL